MSPVSPEDNSNTFLHDSPTSTLGNSSQQYLERSTTRDDHLPEVAGDASPRALTNMEAEYQRQYDQHYYAAQQYKPLQSPTSQNWDEDAAKVVVPSEYDTNVQYPQTAITTHMAVPWDVATVGNTTTSVTSKAEGGFPHEGGGVKEKKILGMSRKAFFILLGVLVIIVVAAVGGGVGGAVAASKSKSAPAPAPAATTRYVHAIYKSCVLLIIKCGRKQRSSCVVDIGSARGDELSGSLLEQPDVISRRRVRLPGLFAQQLLGRGQSGHHTGGRPGLSIRPA